VTNRFLEVIHYKQTVFAPLPLAGRTDSSLGQSGLANVPPPSKACSVPLNSGLDPAAWLKDTLEKLPAWPNSKIDELLPFGKITS
jgi:hypothetical protein